MIKSCTDFIWWGALLMVYNFRRVTKEDVEDFLGWKYEGIYSFFDNDYSQAKINYIKSFPEDENVYSVYNEKDELVGNCAVYLNEKATFSVQMRPCLTSKGYGREFMNSFLDFAKEKYDLNSIGLTVLKFNERALKLYSNLGFEVTEEFIGRTVSGEKEFIAMEKIL